MVSKDTFPVLVCDIGGTNSRMSILRVSVDKTVTPIVVDVTKLKSQDYTSLSNLLSFYLEKYKDTDDYPHIAAIAVPGPIVNNRISVIANLMHWPHSDGDSIGQNLNFKKCVLLNDFVAVGYGIIGDLTIDKDFYNLTCGKSNPDGPYAVVGAGTGLGHGLGYKSVHGKYHEIIPSEGGHQTFICFNDTEWKYQNYLKQKFQINHISHERACSGPAIPYIFNFLIDVEGMEPKLLDKNDKEFDDKRWKLTPEEIITACVEEKCPVANRVGDMFLEMLATDCSNLCLTSLPYKGLYLVGGITLTLQNKLKNSKVFWNRFYHKGRLSEYLKEFPVYLVTDSDVGIKGCQEFCRQIIELQK